MPTSEVGTPPPTAQRPPTPPPPQREILDPQLLRIANRTFTQVFFQRKFFPDKKKFSLKKKYIDQVCFFVSLFDSFFPYFDGQAVPDSFTLSSFQVYGICVHLLFFCNSPRGIQCSLCNHIQYFCVRCISAAL